MRLLSDRVHPDSVLVRAPPRGELYAVLAERPQVVVLHEGPNGERGQRGNAAIRDALIAARTPLAIRGHRHWSEPTCAPHADVQFLNVDKRAVVLQRAED